MAFVHSKNTVVTVDSTDMSAYITSSSELGKSTETHKVTAYGADSHAYTPGLNDGTFSMEGTYDSTATTGPRAKLNTIYAGNAAVTIVIQPEGTGSTLPQDSFSAILTDLTFTMPVADMIAFKTDWQITGDVDITAQT